MDRRKLNLKYVWITVLASMALICFGARVPGFAQEKGGTGQAKVSAVAVSNPVINGDYTKWSYVYFGSYPQSEVAGSRLTHAITSAAYSNSGDAWVDGVKYRRIHKSDASSTLNWGKSEYRYFKWEKIRWRVLTVSEDKLFVMADCGLDCRPFHSKAANVTWENCDLRKWLNGTFYKEAFSAGEQNDVPEVNAKTYDNPLANPKYASQGGFDTKDHVTMMGFLTAKSESCGFGKGNLEESSARKLKGSDYAHARGAIKIDGFCKWWLRTSGNLDENALYVFTNGKFPYIGDPVEYTRSAVVPVMHIKKTSRYLSASGDTDSTVPSDVKPLKAVINGNQAVRENAAASFSVTASGGRSANYTYQWYYEQNGAATMIPGAVYSGYTVSAKADYNGRKYYCRISDGVSSADSGQALLTVYFPPVITKQPQDQTVSMGARAEFSVTVSGGSPSEYTYKWYTADTAQGDGVQLTNIDEKAASILTKPVDDNFLSHDGMYVYCVVSNGWYKVTSERVQLHIYNEKEDPALKKKQSITCKTTKIKNGKVPFGTKPFSLKASASGRGELSYKSSNKKVAAVDSRGEITLKGCGEVTITITAAAAGEYRAASKKMKLIVPPKKMTIVGKGVKDGRKAFVEWKKDKMADGYEFVYAEDKAFTKGKAIHRLSKKSHIGSVAIRPGETLYISVCAYKLVDGNYCYGAPVKVEIKNL